VQAPQVQAPQVQAPQVQAPSNAAVLPPSAVQGVETLPSTSTSDPAFPAGPLGVALIAVGFALLRRRDSTRA
jgi:MYXO-CTERM domain-containing protein